MRLTSSQRAFLEAQRVGYLATVGPDGVPHVVPIVYAVVDETICFVVDDKPKRTRTGLKRLRNIAANPHVAVVVDRYDEDWTRLAYVLIHGAARLVESAEEFTVVLAELRRRYAPYRAMPLDPRTHPMVRIDIEHTHEWAAVR